MLRYSKDKIKGTLGCALSVILLTEAKNVDVNEFTRRDRKKQRE